MRSPCDKHVLRNGAHCLLTDDRNSSLGAYRPSTRRPAWSRCGAAIPLQADRSPCTARPTAIRPVQATRRVFLCVSQQADSQQTNAVDQTVNGALQAAFSFINSALTCTGTQFWLFTTRLCMHAPAQAQLCGVGIAMQTVPVTCS